MSQPGEISLAPSGLILASRQMPEMIQQSRLLIIDADCVDHKLRSSTGFLKSRVYAKLLTRLISERYQTFNRRVEEVALDTA